MSVSLQDLEQAAQVVLAPPNIVTSDQRHSAEAIILNFRKSKLPYDTCKHILETSKNDYVLFQAATTIKESVIREWPLLESGQIESLRGYLLRHITQNISLQSYVREQILQTVAVILKRGTVEMKSSNTDRLFEDITLLISSGNVTMQLVACSMLMALLNEFSTTSRTSSVGLTWEFHMKCKRIFEENDLKRVFLFSLKVLHELEKQPSPLTRENMAVFNRFLTITEQVLNWEFSPPRAFLRRNAGCFEGNTNSVLRPCVSWRDTILDKDLLHLCFQIHGKIRHNSEMAHHSLQCISQLASLTGPVFSTDLARSEYLCAFLTSFLSLFTSIDLHDYESLGISTACKNLVLLFPPSCWSDLPDEILETYINQMTNLTCMLGRHAAQEEAMNKDNTIYMEAYEKVLESWMQLVSDMSSLPSELTHAGVLKMFESYIQCHLSAPEGIRNQLIKSAEDDEEINEVEEDDREKFEDQLSCIGLFGRLVPSNSVTLLAKLLEDRVSRLHGQLQRLQQQHGRSAQGQMDMTILNTLNEDLHWLVLITGNVLTVEAKGETPMIPSPIMHYSIDMSSKVDLTTTLKVLASPSERLESIPGGEQTTDPVVRLISAVFRLCEVEKRAVDADLSSYLSPQVSQTVMWFLRRWAVSYLLPDENYYNQISMTLAAAFGRDTEGGQWTMGFLLDKIFSNITVWSSEEALMNDTLQLLVTLVENRIRCNAALKCQSLWNIAKQESANQPPFDVLPSTSKRHLLKALVLAGSGYLEPALKEEYWKVVLQSVHDRFERLVSKENFPKTCHLSRTKTETISLLESLCGIAEASTGNNYKLIFGFISPLLTESVKLLDIFHNYEDVVPLILGLFSEVIHRQICFLSQVDSQKLYTDCLNVIQMYSKHHIGLKSIQNAAEEEEDKFQDILLIMELLTNLLSKDFLDFGDDDKTVLNKIEASDVIIHGLNIVIPVMNADLLRFPTLCSSYFKLISFLMEDHPEKFAVLPEAHFKMFMASLELGLNSYGIDITKLAMETLQALALHVLKNQQYEGLLAEALSHFLTLVFNMLLLESFDMTLMDIASSSFFALICARKEQYHLLVTELLKCQSVPEYKERLTTAFNNLTPSNVQLTFTPQTKQNFAENFEQFLMDVRGFLCVR